MIVLITGGSSGIGLALAKEFLSLGHEVHVTSRSGEAQPGFIVHQLDLSISESINTFIQSFTKNEIQILVNNAGNGIIGPLVDLTRDQAREQFELNVFGPLELISKLLPKLKNGHIVNVSSISPEVNLPFGGLYSASKAALNTLSEILRLELHPLNIRVTTVRPGLIKTSFAKKAAEKIHIPKTSFYMKFKDQILARSTLSFNATDPEIFANVVVKKILSPNSSAVIYYGKGSFIYPLIKKILPTNFYFWLLAKKFNLL